MSKVSMAELEQKLQGYSGTESYHKISPFYPTVITDGAKAFADICECYWLLADFIAPNCSKHSSQAPFQLVEVNVNKRGTCTITSKEDTDTPALFTKRQRDICNIIPEGKHKFYYIDNVLLLPSEY